MKYTRFFAGMLLLASFGLMAQEYREQGLRKDVDFSPLTGLYSLEDDNAGGECPSKLRVVQRTSEDVEFAGIGTSASLIFKSIEEGKDSIKISSKETYQLRSEIENSSVRLQGRTCRNKIFKKCDDWETLSMVFWSEDGIAISNRESPFVSSGFPNGTCAYKKGIF